MTVKNMNRVPAGKPSGGQFAPTPSVAPKPISDMLRSKLRIDEMIATDTGRPNPLLAYEYNAHVVGVCLAEVYGEGLTQEQKDFLLLQSTVRNKEIEITDEEWKAFLNDTKTMLTKSATFDEDTLNSANFAIEQLKANNDALTDKQKYELMGYRKRLRHAHYALEREYFSIAMFKVPTPTAEDVSARILEYQNEYNNANPKPNIPEDYRKGFMRSGMGLPKDPATIYAFYKTENSTFENGTENTGIRFVALDTETSGLHPHESEIVQLGYTVYDSRGTKLFSKSYDIRPEKTNPDGTCYTGAPEAIAVHGITHDRAIQAERFPAVWEKVAPELQGSVIIGHNLNFDTRQIRQQLNSHKITNPDGEQLRTEQVWQGEIDTLSHAWRHVHHTENRKLVTLAVEYGIVLENAHDAGDDAAAAGDLFFKFRSL